MWCQKRTPLMVKLPERKVDPTLAAIDEALEARQHRERRRGYLGMSAIGSPCARQLWYSFRWACLVFFKAATLKKFHDGHTDEDTQADRLRMVPGLTLITEDPETGRQMGYSDFGGHFRGHQDGHIEGLLQAPKTPHVWEHKASEKQKDLQKHIDKLGEKNALKAWNETYYAQHVLYMDYGGYSRGYLTCSTPGGRQQIAIRTEANPAHAEQLKRKAEKIIFSDNPPDKIRDDETYYICRWCDYSKICHNGAAADRNCRTCTWSTVGRQGGWMCARHNEKLDQEQQEAGCHDHRWNPAFVPGDLVDFDKQKNTLTYEIEGQRWTDGH